MEVRGEIIEVEYHRSKKKERERFFKKTRIVNTVRCRSAKGKEGTYIHWALMLFSRNFAVEGRCRGAGGGGSRQLRRGVSCSCFRLKGF